MKTEEIFKMGEDWGKKAGYEFVGKVYEKGKIPANYLDPKFPEDGITVGFKVLASKTSEWRGAWGFIPYKHLPQTTRNDVVAWFLKLLDSMRPLEEGGLVTPINLLDITMYERMRRVFVLFMGIILWIFIIGCALTLYSLSGISH